MTRKKLIEVALPLEAINVASAREKSIRHGHPSTLHLWWARRPLAAARAVIFTSLVDDPDSPDALPAFVEACKQLPKGANANADDTPRMRLFDFIERLVTWEATTDEAILTTARELIMIATEGNPPPLLDPFAGGGSIPLEAQRLGLEAHASDLNPVAVMINKAQIEIPPRFANMPPVNPRDRAGMFAPHPPTPSPTRGEGEPERLSVPPAFEKIMLEIARKLRRETTASEEILWQALRNKRLDNRKFRRQQPVGAFVLDFYCADERLAVEVDGPIHDQQKEADAQRQEILESLGIRFVRVTAAQVETDLPAALATIRAAFLPSPLRGRGAGGEGHLWRGAAGLAADVRYYGEWMREKAWEKIGHLYPTHNGETVIAWIWARTVKSPNPAVNVHVPLVRSFILSKKKGRMAWVEPIVEPINDGTATHRIRYVVRREQDGDALPAKDEGTIDRRGGQCIVTSTPMSLEYIRAEGKAGCLGVHLIAVVTEGDRARNYYSPDAMQVSAANADAPMWKPVYETSSHPQYMAAYRYGMTTFADLFTSRQLMAMTTFSDLVVDARTQAHADALTAGLIDDSVPLRDGGRGALAYAEAVSVYLSFAVNRLADRCNSLSSWQKVGDKVAHLFARQAISMLWDFAEVNPFSGSSGNFGDAVVWVAEATESIFFETGNIADSRTRAKQSDATLTGHIDFQPLFSTDPPYYDSVPYADLSDFFYVWMRVMIGGIYPDIFNTILVPKSPELVADHQRYGGRSAANEHFENGMFAVFAGIRDVTAQMYPVTVYYAFKQTDTDEEPDNLDDEFGFEENVIASSGWETILQGLIASGFSIVGTWPVRTERASRTRGLGSNALASSIVLVCRPRPTDAPTSSRRAFVDALRRELPAALKNMQSGNIAPVDLAQASIGPGMAIYSRYSRVLEADGSPMSVRAALGLINQELDAYLAEQDGDIDADTRFAVAWFEQFAFTEGEFGMADTLARAKNTSVAGVSESGLVTAGRGKVRLLHWTEYDPANAGRGDPADRPYKTNWDPAADKRPTVWEATHHLIQELNIHGETGSALLMTKLPSDTAAEARALAYRLYSICERKGWAEHARDYNALVISWAGIGEEAARLKQAREAGDATTQTRLFE